MLLFSVLSFKLICLSLRVFRVCSCWFQFVMFSFPAFVSCMCLVCFIHFVVFVFYLLGVAMSIFRVVSRYRRASLFSCFLLLFSMFMCLVVSYMRVYVLPLVLCI